MCLTEELGGCVGLELPLHACSGRRFAGFGFPPQVITVAVRWCLRYGLSYRDVEELLAEPGVEVHPVTRRRRRRGAGGCAGV